MPTSDTTLAFMRATLDAVCRAFADGCAPGREPAPRPSVETLTLTARLARAVGTPDRAVALTHAGTLGVLIMRIAAERAALKRADDLLLPGLIAAALPDIEADVPLCVAEPGPSSCRSRDNRDFLRNLDAAIAKGTPVLAVLSDPTRLSEAARCLEPVTLTLPPCDAEILGEVTRAVFGLSDEPDPDWFTGADTAVFALPPAAVAAAFRAPSAREAVRRLHRFAARARMGTGAPGLDDLHLPEALRRWCRDLEQDLADHATGRVGWDAVSASLFLYGRPGTGKTSTAQAIATTLGLTFVDASYTNCQPVGNLADYLREMERRVDRAINGAPSLIFFDEIDSFAPRTADHGRNTSYMTAVVNQMLQTLSRLANAPGVVVLAATNHPERVDPALLRSGRFDTHIALPLPDRAGIDAILRKSLGDAAGGLDLAPIARRLVGASGADVHTVAVKARATARRAGRSVSSGDLDDAAAQVAPARPQDDLRRIAVHEAGHVVVRAALQLSPARRVAITPDGGQTEAELPIFVTDRSARDLMAVYLAGRAAERHVIGQISSGAERDLLRATEFALALETRFGLGPGAPLYRAFTVTRPERWPEEVRARTAAVIEEAADRAAALVARHASTLEAVSAALLDHRELDEAQLRPLLEPVRQDAALLGDFDAPVPGSTTPASPAPA